MRVLILVIVLFTVGLAAFLAVNENRELRKLTEVEETVSEPEKTPVIKKEKPIKPPKPAAVAEKSGKEGLSIGQWINALFSGNTEEEVEEKPDNFGFGYGKCRQVGKARVCQAQ